MAQEYLNTDMDEDIVKNVILAKPETLIYTNVIDEIRAEFERIEARDKKHNLFLMRKRRKTYDRFHKAH